MVVPLIAGWLIRTVSGASSNKYHSPQSSSRKPGDKAPHPVKDENEPVSLYHEYEGAISREIFTGYLKFMEAELSTQFSPENVSYRICYYPRNRKDPDMFMMEDGKKKPIQPATIDDLFGPEFETRSKEWMIDDFYTSFNVNGEPTSVDVKYKVSEVWGNKITITVRGESDYAKGLIQKLENPDFRLDSLPTPMHGIVYYDDMGELPIPTYPKKD